MKGSRLAPLAVWGLLGLLLALSLLRHEMWRDELQAWMLARDSASLVELWEASRYEGHPLLWHVLLFPLAHLFDGPEAMQVLHWLIVVAGGGILLLAAPFPLAVRVALAFSYLLFYEYGVISRNYALSVAGVWIACVGLTGRGSRWLAVAGAALAANASAMGMLLAPAFAGALVVEKLPRKAKLVLLGALGLAVALAVFQCVPPPDYEHARGWELSWQTLRVAYVLRGLAVALVPVPRLALEFWGSSAFFPSWPFAAELGTGLALVAGAIVATVLGVVAWSVRRSSRSLVVWGVGSAALLAFLYTKLPGALRHHGFLVVLLVAVVWLAVAEGGLTRRGATLLLAPIGLVGLVGTAAACWWDWRAPFSGARCAAETLQRHGLERVPLVGTLDYATSGVAGYLPRGRLYYPAIREVGSYVVWNLARTRQDELSVSDLVAEGLARDRGDGVVLLAIASLDGLPERCQEVAVCGPTIVADETVRIYHCAADREGRLSQTATEMVSSASPPAGSQPRS